MQNVVKLAPPIKPCILLGVTLFLVYDGVGFINPGSLIDRLPSERLGPADNFANKRATLGSAQVPKQQARRAIRSPTERPGRGGTASASDSGPPLRLERSLLTPARLRTTSPTGWPGQTPLPTPTRFSDRECAEHLHTAPLRLPQSEPTRTNRPGMPARKRPGNGRRKQGKAHK